MFFKVPGINPINYLVVSLTADLRKGAHEIDGNVMVIFPHQVTDVIARGIALN